MVLKTLHPAKFFTPLLILLCLSLSADGQQQTSGQYKRYGSDSFWTCGLNALAATLTQCQAAPGANLVLYITDIMVQTTTATSGTFAIQTGTGANCVTGTAALFPVSGTANRFNAPPTSAPMSVINFQTPLKVPANTAVCVIGVATNTISIQLAGFTGS